MTETTTGSKKDWQHIASQKRESAFAKIPKEWLLPSSITDGANETSDRNVLDVPRTCGILSEKELDLTEKYDATALVDKLAKGEVSSLDVTTAFCKRAALAGQLTFCLTEIFFEIGLERAKYLDEYLKTERKPLGPLHGLPISLKDGFNLKSIQSTLGFVSYIEQPPATKNSALVDILLDLGAVLYVKTNIPQTLMTGDSHNNVFGRTLNPTKLLLGAGGSSGGEGALVAMRGSPLGIGTDIAGSIRIPALCNGTVGFKPTVGRIPLYGGQLLGRDGAFGILACAGPLGHSVRDMELLMRVVGNSDAWKKDPFNLAPIWRDVPSTEGKKLRLGLITEDSKYPLHPPILRAISSAKAALEKAGHAIVPLKFEPTASALLALAWKYFSLDTKKTVQGRVLSTGEPFIPSLATTTVPELKDWEPTLDEVWDMNVERNKIVEQYHDMIVQNELDAIMLPGYSGTAQPHDRYGVPPYTALGNILNYPAGVIPYLKAEKEADKRYDRTGQQDITYVPLYEPDAVEGAPCSIQVMAPPMRDEELIKILGSVNSVLNP